ncbi:MAG: dihydropteroate synthase [Thermodesulfobacteriota bacterium]|nr:dihydropteroate synthase [Thermodesulfobacteriota bacterium]
MKDNTVTEMKSTKTSSSLTIIGQDMHIMNAEFVRAVAQQDGKSLATMAEKQVAAGADELDLNLGLSKKSGKRFQWAVETIRDAVDVPLFISSHVLSHANILEEYRGRLTVNSVTADPTTLATAMEKGQEYGAKMVVLLVRPGLTPHSVDERLQVAADVLETAARVGFSLTDLYLDPLFHLRPDPVSWQLSRGVPDVDSVLETIEMLPQLSEEKVRTLVALSSASQFLPRAERAGLHHLLLPLLVAAGLDAVILNCHDNKLMEIAGNPQSNIESDLSSIAQVRADLDTATLPW